MEIISSYSDFIQVKSLFLENISNKAVIVRLIHVYANNIVFTLNIRISLLRFCVAQNALQLSFFIFFSFSFSSVLLNGRTKAFSYVSLITGLGTSDQYQTNFIGHTKTRCVRKVG